VLVCSLTKAGAKQAARDIELPYSQLGTMHSFAYRALGSPTLAESKAAEWNEAYPQFALSWSSATTDDSYGSTEGKTDGDQAKLDVAWYRTMDVPIEHWTKPGAIDFYTAWTDWKKNCGYLDFTDLIETATRDCEKAPGEPAVLLCDEAQDTGKLEMRLLMKWAEQAEHLVLFGDSAQAIFSWRGSDALLLQRLWLQYDAGRPHLSRTYRLSRQVYAYAYNWAKEWFAETLALEFTPRDVEGTFRLIPQSFGQFAPSALERLVEEYTQDDKTLMFQAICAHMLDPLINVLREIGVPFHSPGRITNGKWNPLPQRRSKGHTVIDRVLAFMRPVGDVWGEQARFWTVEDLKAWVGGLPATGILERGKAKEIEQFSAKATDEDIADMMPSWFTPEALRAIVPKPDLAWYIGHMTKGSDNLRKYVMEVINRHGVGALRKRPQVEVGTVHALKGREADTVVLAPDMSLMAYQAAHRSEERAEELKRVFYVGVTRARDNLVLAAPSGKTFVRW
jgi:superfamily I DNA/RNA helicase